MLFKKSKIFILILQSLVLSCSVAPAISSGSETIKDCSSAQSQVKLDSCRTDAHKNAKKRLQKKYDKLLSSYRSNEPNLVCLLTAAKNQWQLSVKSDCEMEAYYSRGGAAYHSEYLSCVENRTLFRLQYFENMEAMP